MTKPIAVVGATGLVGRQVLAALWQRDVEPDDVRPMASERSDGVEVDYAEETLPVEVAGPDAFRHVGVVILATPPQVAPGLAVAAQQAGAWVVDVSGASRADARVPLLAPGVNDAALERPFAGRVVTLASPAAQALALTLEPLRAGFSLAGADATLLYGAALRGAAGVERLSQQTASLLNAKEPDVDVFPHRLAFNVIPGVGDFEEGLSAEERHLLVELARVWAAPDTPMPGLTATAFFVPTFHGTTLSVTAYLERPTSADALKAAFAARPGLKVLDAPDTHVYPMPMLATDDEAIHVGRLRVQKSRVQYVAALDNAFRAAGTAVDLALRLLSRP